MSARTRRGGDRYLRKDRLARELTFVLVAKIVALTLIWFAFFRAAPAVDPADLLERHPPPSQQAQR